MRTIIFYYQKRMHNIWISSYGTLSLSLSSLCFGSCPVTCPIKPGSNELRVVQFQRLTGQHFTCFECSNTTLHISNRTERIMYTKPLAKLAAFTSAQHQMEISPCHCDCHKLCNTRPVWFNSVLLSSTLALWSVLSKKQLSSAQMKS